MKHKRQPFTDSEGNARLAICPVIVSASRATDVPAFFAPWLMERIQDGYTLWRNPFNGTLSQVSFSKTRLFVFWSKHPAPLIRKLKQLDDLGYHYYFQYTLNDYVAEGWEPGLPSLEDRIDTFMQLSELIGKEKVIWRCDPLILSSTLGTERLIERIARLGERLHPYTERLVFSFVDIDGYRRVRSRLARLDQAIRPLTIDQMQSLASSLASLNNGWCLRLATCAESLDLSGSGIEANRCIDDRLLAKLFPEDQRLMQFLGRKADGTASDDQYQKLKDRGQRSACGCILSKDIGLYRSCRYGCIYCYAK